MEDRMMTRWTRAVALTLAMMLTAHVAFAEPEWLTIPAGATVQVVMKNGRPFEAIWMGRVGDRAVFERLHSDETLSVRIDAVRRVHLRGAAPALSSADARRLGIAAGFWGPVLLLGLIASHN
jgi:hypothetical protein